jgi:uncharacterized protein
LIGLVRYFSTEEGASDVLFRLRDDHDGAEPAANSIAAMNLLRLGSILGRTEFRDAVNRVMISCEAVLEKSPAAMPQMLAALSGLLAEPVQVVIATRDKLNEPLIRAIGPLFLPDKIVLCADQDDPWLSQNVPALKGMELIDDKPAAYVCRNFTCELPVTTVEELRPRLQPFGIANSK